jgi:hypothetical protein
MILDLFSVLISQSSEVFGEDIRTILQTLLQSLPLLQRRIPISHQRHHIPDERPPLRARFIRFIRAEIEIGASTPALLA